MRVLITFLIAMLLTISGNAMSLTVQVTKAGDLINLIDQSKVEQVDSLTINGELSSSELYQIRKFENLKYLDLSNTIGLKAIPYRCFQSHEYYGYTMYSLQDVKLPLSIHTIENYAFDGLDLNIIVIPKNVKVIESYAFSCIDQLILEDSEQQLEIEYGNFRNHHFSYSIQTSLSKFYWGRKILGDMKFSDCKEVEIGQYVDSIPDNMFKGFYIQKIELPKAIKHIGKSAFANTEIHSIEIPSGVSVLSDDLFNSCKNLENIKINGFISRIGMATFKDCPNLTTIELSVDSIKEIGFAAFEGCENLLNFNIPPFLQTIPERMMYNCNSLYSLKIPSHVMNIGKNAFAGCNHILELIVEDSDSPLKGVWLDGSEIQKIYLGRQVDLTFGEYKFLNNAVLTAYYRMIPDNAFRNCVNLKEVFLNDSITEIGDYAFNGCESLTNIVLPSNLRKIGKYAFNNCRGQEKLVIPNNVTNIGDYAFRNWYELDEVEIGIGLNNLDCMIFEGCSNIHNLIFLDFSNPITLKAIDNLPIKNLYIGRTLETSPIKVDISAFSKNLQSVEFGEYVYDLPSRMFSYCKLLNSISLPQNLNTIGNMAFYNSGIESIQIPASVHRIAYDAFQECLNLETIIFEDCPDPLTLLAPKDNRENALEYRSPFYNCPLNYIYYGRNIRFDTYYSPFRFTTGNNAEIIFGNNVSTIDMCVLYHNDKVSTISLSSNTTNLGGYSFWDCHTIRSVKCEALIPPDGTYQDFSETTYNLATLFVPKGSLDLYKNAVVWKNFCNIEEIKNESSIEDVRTDPQTIDRRVFNLNGVQMPNCDIENLPAGIYIINGEKRLIHH